MVVGFGLRLHKFHRIYLEIDTIHFCVYQCDEPRFFIVWPFGTVLTFAQEWSLGAHCTAFITYICVP